MYRIDFIGRAKLWVSISVALILIGIASMIVGAATGRGALHFGIDFTGGTILDVRFDKPVDLGRVRRRVHRRVERHDLARFFIHPPTPAEIFPRRQEHQGPEKPGPFPFRRRARKTQRPSLPTQFWFGSLTARRRWTASPAMTPAAKAAVPALAPASGLSPKVPPATAKTATAHMNPSSSRATAAVATPPPFPR